MEGVTPKDRRVSLRYALAALFCLFLGLAFVRPLYLLFTYALGTTLHSHIVLVPLISAYLIGIEQARLPTAGRPSFLPAALLGLLGSAAFFIWQVPATLPLSENDCFAVLACSFLCFVWAGGFLLFGKALMKAVAFPMAFLIFMVPLPDGVADLLETASKFASADAAAAMINLSGVPMLRQGVIFRLPGIAIEVAQECSGIRSSWVLFITSLLASHLFLRSNWRRAFLVAFVIPLGVVRNGFRIAVIAWLCVHYGPEMIHSIIHRRGGPFFFVLSLIPLFALLWWLRRGEMRQKRAAGPV